MATKNPGNLRVLRTGRDRLKSIVGRTRGKRTVKCIPYPNRSRQRNYTAKDLGRIACIVRTRSGATLLEILNELKECAPCQEEQSKAGESAISATVAQIAAQSSIDQAVDMFQRFVEFLRRHQTFLLGLAAALAALLVIIRGGAALLPLIGGTAVRLALTRVSTLQAHVVAEQAANSAVFQILRQSAANNVLFRRVVGL